MGIVRATLLLLLSVSGAAAQARSPQYEQTLTRAQQALAEGRSEQVKARARKLVEQSPDDPRAVRLLASLLPPPAAAATLVPGAPLAALGREVLAACERAFATQDRIEPDLMRLAGWAQALTGDVSGAVTRVAPAASDDSGYALLLQLATLGARLGELRGADLALSAALQLRPQEPLLYTDLAAVRVARGRPEAAVSLLEARQASGNAVPAGLERDLAGALLAAGETREALALYAKLGASCPPAADCALDLPRAALQAGDLAAAERSARALADGRRQDPVPQVLLAEALVRRGDAAAARAAYEEALRRDPRHVAAREGLAALQAR